MEKTRVYFQKSPRLCRHHAHTCFNTCARGAGTHGDVLNVHTGAGGHRQFCLPKFAHVWSSRASEVPQKTFQSFPFSSLRIDSDRHVTDSSNHSLYLIRLFSFSNLEGICGPDGSISLPPLSPQQHTTHNTQRLRQRHRDRDKERRQNQVLRTIHTSDTFHDVLFKVPLTFHSSFTYFATTLVFKHKFGCYRESSMTPQHSKWNCVGTKQATAHAHVQSRCTWLDFEHTKNSNHSKKNATTNIEFESAN